MEAPIVTLTTDWGRQDYYAASVKGRLLSLVPDVRIVDLSHEQSWKDMVTLMQVIRYGCLSFPEGTIHIIDAGCEPLKMELQSQNDGLRRFVPEPVLVCYKGQYLICSESRPLSWALEEPPDKVVMLTLPEELTSYSFLACDLYCDVVRHLATGGDPESLGTVNDTFRLMRAPMQPHDGYCINAVVTHIDSYGNAQLNLTYDDFEAVRAGRRFTADLDNRSGVDTIRVVSTHYNDVRIGNLLLLVSHSGYLQLAVNGGSAAQLLGLRPTSPCRIKFYD